VDFLVLQKHVDEAGLASGAAESHGMLCGLVCGAADEAEARWISELFAELDARDLLVQECQQALRALAAETVEAFDSPGLGVSLLLPGDHSSMAERVEALRDWSNGFLYGLGLAGVSLDALSAEAAEALQDVTEITRLDVEDPSEQEADEEAYAELAEFLWVAAMMVHTDLSMRAGVNNDGE
jgi:hypothetical protein